MAEQDDPRCPFCKGGLRRRDGWTGLDTDSKGPFVTCRHCDLRVAMEEIPRSEGSPEYFRVAPDQR
jgi:hypothetical protein